MRIFIALFLLSLTFQTMAEPQRVITFSPAVTEIAYALKASDQVVAISQYSVYPPEVKDKPQVGALLNPNYERIISLKPDLLMIQGKQEKLKALCKKRKIKYVEIHIENIDDIKSATRQIGILLEHQKEAEEICRTLDRELAELAENLKMQKNKPKVYLSVSRQKGSLSNLMTTGGDTFLNELVEKAGGVNIFKDLKRYPQIAKESLVKREPEIILEFMPGRKMDEKSKTLVQKSWKRLSTIPAVKNNRIEILTNDSILMPTPRIVDSIRDLQKIILTKPKVEPEK